MAEKILQTRILNKVDTLANWNNSSLKIKKGEICFATVAATAGLGLEEPVVLAKIGGNEEKTFAELPWSFYAKASDVLAACKSEASLKAFINGVISDAGIATDEALAALAGKVTTAEGKISALEGKVGEKDVAVQINEAITALNLANTYDAKGAAAQALTDAKGYADGLNTAMNTRVEALEAVDHEHANAAELAKIAEGDKAKWDAMEQNAKDYADGLDDAMDTRVLALEAKFGDGEGNVESQIAAAVDAEKSAREAADTALGNRVKAVEDDYLKAADKTALQEQITANDGEIAALQGLVGEGDVTERINAAVAAEAAIARAAEKANADAIDAIEADYLKAADKTDLQNQINTIMNNPDTEGVINSINEFTQYIADHGEIAEGFRTDIDANAGEIAAIKGDYLKAADKSTLQGEIDALEGRMDTAEGKISGLEGSVATKAAQADLESVTGRVGTVEGKVSTLEGEMDSAEGRLTALEGLVEEGNVTERINAAIAALKIGDYAKAADLGAAVERIAANEGEITGLKGRMDTAEGNITNLQGRMGTAEGEIDALQADIVKKANDADLAAIAKSGNVNDLVQTTGDVLVFDCGSSAV